MTIQDAATLADHQVLQRSGDGTWITSTEPLDVRGPAGEEVAATKGPDRVWLPTGGPYTVHMVTAGGPVRVVRDVFVGDLWVLAGQSNMQGAGWLRDLEPPRPEVRVFGMERRWQAPREPLHRPWLSPDPVHHGLWPETARLAIEETIEAGRDTDTAQQGAGLGIAFANELVAATGIPVGLLPVAQGGSSLAQWAPEHPGGEGHCLYRSMLASVRDAGGAIAGMLWYQGESETGSDEVAATYTSGTRAIFDSLRRDLARPELPIYHAQLGGFPIVRDLPTDWRWTNVRIAQLDCLALGTNGVVATIDLTRADPIHLDTPALRQLGHRFALLATGRARTPRLADVKISGSLVDWPTVPVTMAVELRFEDVSGRLTPSTRVHGFSVRDGTGNPLPSIWHTEVDPEQRATVRVLLAGPGAQGGTFLWYGWGAAADGNLVDSAGMAVPAFGPIDLGASSPPTG